MFASSWKVSVLKFIECGFAGNRIRSSVPNSWNLWTCRLPACHRCLGHTLSCVLTLPQLFEVHFISGLCASSQVLWKSGELRRISFCIYSGQRKQSYAIRRTCQVPGMELCNSIIRPTRCTICFQFITINSLYMFRALICSFASWWWASKCSKHVEAINGNKLKANSASCWSYYTDILQCTVNKTLRNCVSRDFLFLLSVFIILSGVQSNLDIVSHWHSATPS
jgi:hypothetical protein